MLIRSAALLIVATLALAGCSDDSSDKATDSSASDSGVSCTYASDGQQPAKEVDPPPDHATETGDVDATMKTSIGDLGLTLDADRAPCTVNSFVSLAQQGYFDATDCHRLTTSGIFVLQCGDPTGTGTGGPGYTIKDELEGDESYPAGTLAMAKTSAPNSGGSQFFVVYADTQLPPDYTVFGTVDKAGIEAVQKVAKQGTDNANGAGDGHPKTPVKIESVTISD